MASLAKSSHNGATPNHSATTKTLTVIGYHEITNNKNALIPEYAVSTAQFQQHIEWLEKQGFHFITVDQLISANKGKSTLPAKPVLLTGR